MDAMEVKPRYTSDQFQQPAMQAHMQAPMGAPVDPTYGPSAQSAQSVQQITPLATGGILTSVYDNKIIVICIIVAILLIAAVAYIFCRKPDEPEQKPTANKPKTKTQQTQQPPTESQQSNQNAESEAQQNEQPEQNEQTKQPEQPGSTEPMQNNKAQKSAGGVPRKNLLDLYNRMQNNQQTTPQINKQPNSKSVEEISEFMEDDTADTGADTADGDNVADEEDDATYDL